MPKPAEAVASGSHSWPIFVNEAVLEELRRCPDSTALAYSRLLKKLQAGDFSESRRPYLDQDHDIGRLFVLSRIQRRLVLLWTIELHHGSQVICAIRSLTEIQMHPTWKTFQSERASYPTQYRNACEIRCEADTAPKTGLDDLPKPIWADVNIDNEPSSVKYFDLNDGPLVEILATADRGRRERLHLPYILDETQTDAVRFVRGPIVVVGRAGTGKTSVLVTNEMIALVFCFSPSSGETYAGPVQGRDSAQYGPTPSAVCECQFESCPQHSGAVSGLDQIVS
jgi:hypothetical protein